MRPLRGRTGEAGGGESAETFRRPCGESAVELTDTDQRLVFAVSLADVDATVTRLTRLSVLISGVILLLTGAAAGAIARLGLRPLEKIEETAERIAAGDLSERVPTYRPRTEIGRLAHGLNGMLVQIERAFTARTESEEKLRRFVSDASHELRTPLATIRGHAEMWRTGVTDDLTTVMTRIESESMRMGDLVDDMLLLARLDQLRPLEQEPVVIGDEARLRQILANLLTNALVHTPVSSPIAIEVQVRDARVQVTLRDGGPGMPPEALSKVFDRFYRADTGRSRDHGGSGLGLAIVKSLTEAHRGTVTCTSDVTRGTTFTLGLPLA